MNQAMKNAYLIAVVIVYFVSMVSSQVTPLLRSNMKSAMFQPRYRHASTRTQRMNSLIRTSTHRENSQVHKDSKESQMKVEANHIQYEVKRFFNEQVLPNVRKLHIMIDFKDEMKAIRNHMKRIAQANSPVPIMEVGLETMTSLLSLAAATVRVALGLIVVAAPIMAFYGIRMIMYFNHFMTRLFEYSPLGLLFPAIRPTVMTRLMLQMWDAQEKWAISKISPDSPDDQKIYMDLAKKTWEDAWTGWERGVGGTLEWRQPFIERESPEAANDSNPENSF